MKTLSLTFAVPEFSDLLALYKQHLSIHWRRPEWCHEPEEETFPGDQPAAQAAVSTDRCERIAEHPETGEIDSSEE